MVNHLRKKLNFAMLRRTVARTMVIFWRYDRVNLLSYIAVIAVQVATSLGAIYLTGRTINELVRYLQRGADNRTLILQLVIGAALLGAIEQIAWRLLQFIQRRSYYTWHIFSITEFNKKTSSLDMEYFEDRDFNNTLNKLRQDGHSFKPANFAYEQLNVLHAVVRTVSSGIIIARFAPWVIPLILLSLVPSLLVQQRESKLNWGIWGVRGDTNRRFWKVTDLLQQKNEIREIRIMGLQSYLIDYAYRMLKDFTSDQRKILGRFIWPALAARIFEGAIVASLELWLIFKVLARSAGFGIGNYTFYTGVINQFNNSSGLVISTLGSLYTDMLFVDEFYTFLDVPDIIQKPKNPYFISKNAKPSIEFKNVSFRYPTGTSDVFKGLSLTIPYGQHIALVGENGSGKSTLISLLMRFYDVTEGSILIDGHDIRTIDLESWYYHLGALFQDFNRYPFDIADNIHFGRIELDKKQTRISAAAEDSGVSSIAKSLPYGYKTILDTSFKEGIEPSGGQWQRVALARAFYRQADILILDEPTAAIDAKAEYDIFRHIGQTQKNRTTIIVSHRFSTVRKADRIIVLEHGKVVEEGSHEKLVGKRTGLYKKMFELQAEGYR